MSTFKFDFNISQNDENIIESTSDIQSSSSNPNLRRPQQQQQQHHYEHQQIIDHPTNIKENDNEQQKRMPLSIINIHELLLHIDQCHQWKHGIIDLRNSLEDMRKESNDSDTPLPQLSSSPSFLKRIVHTERPFGNDGNNPNDNIGIDLLDHNNNMDIIPGKYEGGLKVWECSIDLCNFLFEKIQFIYSKRQCMEEVNSFNDIVTNAIYKALSNGGSTVELGCGHALPGCLLLREIINIHHDASMTKPLSPPTAPTVLFTDYNSFVLRDVTLPNIILNCINKNNHKHPTLSSITKLIAGDWMELSKQIKTNKRLQEELNLSCDTKDNCSRFDLILASETTYTVTSSKETAYWLFHHLKYNTGVGLVSMKRFYFGVGGSTDSFRESALSIGLTVDLLREYNDGSSNIRDLLMVRLLG